MLLLNVSDLNDTLINAAHSLLSFQFNEIEGFQNTLLAYNLKFQPVSIYSTLSIKILHAGTYVASLHMYIFFRSYVGKLTCSHI